MISSIPAESILDDIQDSAENLNVMKYNDSLYFVQNKNDEKTPFRIDYNGLSCKFSLISLKICEHVVAVARKIECLDISLNKLENMNPKKLVATITDLPKEKDLGTKPSKKWEVNEELKLEIKLGQSTIRVYANTKVLPKIPCW